MSATEQPPQILFLHNRHTCLALDKESHRMPFNHLNDKGNIILGLLFQAREGYIVSPCLSPPQFQWTYSLTLLLGFHLLFHFTLCDFFKWLFSGIGQWTFNQFTLWKINTTYSNMARSYNQGSKADFNWSKRADTHQCDNHPNSTMKTEKTGVLTVHVE